MRQKIELYKLIVKISTISKQENLTALNNSTPLSDHNRIIPYNINASQTDNNSQLSSSC